MSISEIAEAISVLKELRKKTYEELISDKVVISAVLWNLYIAIQGCIDVGLKIIGHLDLGYVTSYSDVFNVLYESKIISKELSEKLKKMAKFRNVLAHLYTKIDLRRVYSILQNNLDDIVDFLREIKDNLERRGIKIDELGIR